MAQLAGRTRSIGAERMALDARTSLARRGRFSERTGVGGSAARVAAELCRCVGAVYVTVYVATRLSRRVISRLVARCRLCRFFLEKREEIERERGEREEGRPEFRKSSPKNLHNLHNLHKPLILQGVACRFSGAACRSPPSDLHAGRPGPRRLRSAQGVIVTHFPAALRLITIRMPRSPIAVVIRLSARPMASGLCGHSRDFRASSA